MKKYLALVVLGLMLVLAQPTLAQCGCPIYSSQTVCPQPVFTGAACPCPPPCQPACPTCPPRITYQPVIEQVQPVIQTVAEPVLYQGYQYRQIATCPTSCCPTGAAAPIMNTGCCPTGLAAPLMNNLGCGCGPMGAAIPIPVYQVDDDDDGFWSFLGFD